MKEMRVITEKVDYRVLVIVFSLMLIVQPASAISLSDILKGTQDAALNLFVRQVMPVDGWKKVEKGYALVVKGQNFWNPDYWVVFNGGKVKFWGFIPTDVDINVEVYKVYFGFFAVPYDQYDDIWWKKGEIGSGWIGGFFVSGFDWKWLGGESDVRYAWIAYNSPSIDDLSASDLNLTQSASNLKLEIAKWNGGIRIGGIYILR